MPAACAIQLDVTQACCVAASDVSSNTSHLCSACAGTANKDIAAEEKSSCRGVPSDEAGVHRGVALLNHVARRKEAVEFRRNLSLSGGPTNTCTMQSGDCFVQVTPQYQAIFKGIGAASSATCCSSLAPIIANAGPMSDDDKIAFCQGCQGERAENVDLDSLYQLMC